jgi:Uma2 family endonuclease
MTQTLSKPAETKTQYTVTWEKLPDDFKLPDDPVENIDQPLLAAALREALDLAGFILASMLIASNFGLCAKVNDKIVVKAPDWVYVPSVLPAEPGEVRRSYTRNAEGEVPAVVMEFLSDTDGSEYSNKPTYPYGKWRFYERILQVPIYVIFEPKSGVLEVYRLSTSGEYELQEPDANQRFWIESMGLFWGFGKVKNLRERVIGCAGGMRMAICCCGVPNGWNRNASAPKRNARGPKRNAREPKRNAREPKRNARGPID